MLPVPDLKDCHRFYFLRSWQRYLAPRSDKSEYRKLLLIVNLKLDRLYDRYGFSNLISNCGYNVGGLGSWVK